MLPLDWIIETIDAKNNSQWNILIQNLQEIIKVQGSLLKSGLCTVPDETLNSLAFYVATYEEHALSFNVTFLFPILYVEMMKTIKNKEVFMRCVKPSKTIVKPSRQDSNNFHILWNFYENLLIKILQTVTTVK